MENLGGNQPLEITPEKVIEALLANREDIEPLAQFIDQLQAKVDREEIGLLELSKQIADLYLGLVQKDLYWVEHTNWALDDLAQIANQKGDQEMLDFVETQKLQVATKQRPN
ncbi:MAG: hypothetical protein WC385_01425 [Candidatus Paceibacterota bacterium]